MALSFLQEEGGREGVFVCVCEREREAESNVNQQSAVTA